MQILQPHFPPYQLPCRERLCRILKQLGKTRKNICLLWRTVLFHCKWNGIQGVTSTVIQAVWNAHFPDGLTLDNEEEEEGVAKKDAKDSGAGSEQKKLASAKKGNSNGGGEDDLEGNGVGGGYGWDDSSWPTPEKRKELLLESEYAVLDSTQRCKHCLSGLGGLGVLEKMLKRVRSGLNEFQNGSPTDAKAKFNPKIENFKVKGSLNQSENKVFTDAAAAMACAKPISSEKATSSRSRTKSTQNLQQQHQSKQEGREKAQRKENETAPLAVRTHSSQPYQRKQSCPTPNAPSYVSSTPYFHSMPMGEPSNSDSHHHQHQHQFQYANLSLPLPLTSTFSTSCNPENSNFAYISIPASSGEEEGVIDDSNVNHLDRKDVSFSSNARRPRTSTSGSRRADGGGEDGGMDVGMGEVKAMENVVLATHQQETRQDKSVNLKLGDATTVGGNATGKSRAARPRTRTKSTSAASVKATTKSTAHVSQQHHQLQQPSSSSSSGVMSTTSRYRSMQSPPSSTTEDNSSGARSRGSSQSPPFADGDGDVEMGGLPPGVGYGTGSGGGALRRSARRRRSRAVTAPEGVQKVVTIDYDNVWFISGLFIYFIASFFQECWKLNLHGLSLL
jgi:hypothetical protein